MINTVCKSTLALVVLAASSLGMGGCSGNSNSTSSIGSPVITPITVDKTITDVEWDANNQLEVASHAYRSIAKNSMLSTLYSGQSAVFSSFITLVQGSRDRSCNSSGSIDATLAARECKNSADAVVDCETATDIVKTSTVQSAIFYRCQDGTISGNYFDGPLVVESTTDISVANERTVGTRISARAEVRDVGDNGKFVTNDDGSPAFVDATDFLQQNDVVTFFMTHDLVLETKFNNAANRYENLEACTTPPTDDKPGTAIPKSETLRTNSPDTDKVAFLQQDTPYLPYVEFENVELSRSFDAHKCVERVVDGESEFYLDYDRSHFDLTAKVASKAMGTQTDFFWRDLVIPTDQKNVEGTLTLTHTNPTGSAAPTTVVTLEFNGDEPVTISDANGSTSMSLSKLLEHSKQPESEASTE